MVTLRYFKKFTSLTFKAMTDGESVAIIIDELKTT